MVTQDFLRFSKFMIILQVIFFAVIRIYSINSWALFMFVFFNGL